MMGTLLLPRVDRALQINMYPFDLKHVVHCLPHQLRVFEDQVDRIHLTVDGRAASAGRYKSDNFDEAAEELYRFLKSIQAQHPKLEVDIVDYGPQACEQVSATFFRSSPTPYPQKAFDGGPFHVYFWGIAQANARYVVHMDSDMLFGGASQTWVREATELLAANRKAVFVAPLGGPPRFDGKVEENTDQVMPGLNIAFEPKLISDNPITVEHQTVSTRIFMIDMLRFAGSLGSLVIERPSLKRRIRSWAFNHDPSSMPAEEVLSRALINNGLTRLDYLGSGDGLYSLHPVYRSAEFYANLPNLIDRIERGDIPDAQRGHYDINESMQDWTSAHLARTPLKRYKKALRHLLDANITRFQQSK
jgi:hypothetical protein